MWALQVWALIWDCMPVLIINSSFVPLKNAGEGVNFFEIDELKGIDNTKALSNTLTGKLVQFKDTQ